MQEGYKQTEIGIIPKDWNVVTLADVCSKNGIVRGPFGGALKKEIFVSEGYKVYEQGNAIYRSITRGKYYIDSNKYNEMLRFAVNVGDFIVSCSGTIGMIYKIPKNAPKGIINQALLKLSIDRSVVDSNYFYLYFSWEEFNNRITDDTQGGAIKNLVSMELFKKTWLLLPSLTEQEHIAEALSDVDSMISSLEKLIAKKKAVKQGAMQELLTGKKRLPGFDGEWTEVTMDSYVDFQVGFPFSSAYFNNASKGVRLIKNRDLKSEDQIYYTTESYASEYVVENGDILVGMDGDFLPCRWQKGKALLNQRVGRLLPKKNLDGPFAYYALQKPLAELQNGTGATTVKHLSHGDIKKLVVPMSPTIEEQTAIASIFSDMDNEIEALEQKLEKTRQIKQGMMQQLLTGKIRLV